MSVEFQGRSAHQPGLMPLIVDPRQSLPRTGQALAIALVFLWEWLFHGPSTPLAAVLSALSLIGQIGMCVFPVPCCLATVVIYIATCLTGELSGPSQLLAVALAIGTLSFDLPNIGIVIAITVPLLGSMTFQSIVHPLQEIHQAHDDVPVLAFLLFLVVFFGYSSRQRTEYLETKVKAEQAAELRRRVEVARLIHDSVTGDLSNIARVAQRQTRITTSGPDREVWRMVNERTIRVLDSVHAVIRQLSNQSSEHDVVQPSSPDAPRGEGFMPELRTRVDRNIKRLDEAGFHGQVRVIDHARYVNDEDPKDVSQRTSCVLHLVDEVFANILRHGQPGADSYQVTITCENSQVEVVSVNPIMSDQNAEMIDDAFNLPGGEGLRFHRGEVERLGGVLSADEEDGEWVVYARVPRRQPRRDEAME